MKRNFLLLLGIILSISVFAQAPLNSIDWSPNLNQPEILSNNSKEKIREVYKERFQSSNVRDENYWLSYALDLDSLNFFIAELSGNYLFPDSDALVTFVDDQGQPVYDHPFVHSLGNVLNPLSFIFQIIDGVTLTENDPYFLDSMAVYYAYTRMTDASVVDTMVISLFQAPAGSSNLPTYFYADNSSSNNYWLNTYGYDTVRVPFIKYSYTKNTPNATGLTTIKIPLLEEDSSIFYHLKIFSTNNLAVAAGNVVACGVAFKPGYTYAPFDTIDQKYNVMFFASYEENGAGTFPSYTPDDNNVSSIINTDVRYNISSGYNGLYIPTYAFNTAPYSFEDHLFLFHVTTEPVGIAGVDKNDVSFSLYPNPAADNILLDYVLEQSGDMQVKLTDVAGRVIQSLNLTNQVSGKHQLTLSLEKLTAGPYFVSVRAGNDTPLIKKLMVGK